MLEVSGPSTSRGRLLENLRLPPTPYTAGQIMGGMLNGVSPNYRDMAPSLRSLTSISYNRCAVQAPAHSARPA